MHVLQCGQPMQQTNCVTCGSAIGGTNHRAVASNRAARTYVFPLVLKPSSLPIPSYLISTELITPKLAIHLAILVHVAVFQVQSVLSHLLLAVLLGPSCTLLCCGPAAMMTMPLGVW